MTTQTLNRADYCYSEASELLNLPTATIIDMVNNGTLEHTDCGKRITRESLQAAMAPGSEGKWLHGEKAVKIEPGEMLPNPEGWISWHGGECPVDVNVKVEARLRGGHSGHGLAGEFGWRHHDISTRYDVIAYRVVADDVPEDPPQSVAEGILQGLREFDEALNQMCEGTPAEQRLREVGVTFDRSACHYYMTDGTRIDGLLSEELEAIAAHMREQKGGGE